MFSKKTKRQENTFSIRLNYGTFGLAVTNWETSKHLLAHYDGMATEIFLVGLPISKLPAVVSVLSDLPALEVTAFNSVALEHNEPFDSHWRSQFESTPIQNCQHSLLSANGSAQHLQVYLWIDTSADLLELELVFWNDRTFPHGLPVEEYEQRLQSLCSIVEQCRFGVPNARYILCPEHNGPIEELEKNDYIVQW